MRLILSKIIFYVVLFLVLVFPVYALRATRPPSLKSPITQDQVSELNRYLEEMWNMQYGRYEADIVTTSKSSAKNGEIWLIQTGSTVRLQFKGADHVFTISPDGF